MPALPLSPEQKEDARRLFRLYEKWKSDQRQAGARASQEMVAAALGFASQSAVSQYMKGGIPLNQDAVAKFAKFFGVSPAEISPTISAQMTAIAEVVAGDIVDTSDHAPSRLERLFCVRQSWWPTRTSVPAKIIISPTVDR